MNILDNLRKREIFKDITNEEKFNNLNGNESVYIGFDPTAESLHLGNYVQISILKRFEQFGFKPLAILGGATGMIGDPSGKASERTLQSIDELLINKNKIKQQLESFGLKVVDNYDFYKDMSIIDFLRDIGKLLNVNYMISKDVVSSRLESGISFTEFSYQLIQGWDFKKLYEEHNTSIQVGGSDQWGNITAGVEIIRKTIGDKNTAIGITTNLLTTSSGAKFGKSEGNALWLDPKMTTPYELYQYLLSTDDEDVKRYLNWLTFLDNDEIDKIINLHSKESFKKEAQKILAYEVVKDIHGIDNANKSKNITEILYGNVKIESLTTNDALSIEGSVPTFENIKGNIIDVLIEVNMANSKREAREFIDDGAISVNGIKATHETIINNDYFDKKANIIRRGKKKTILIKY